MLMSPSPTKPVDSEPAEGCKFLDSKGLRQRYGGRSEQWVLHQLARNPKFPKPIKIGRRHRLWSVALLEQYEDQLVEEVNRENRKRKHE